VSIEVLWRAAAAGGWTSKRKGVFINIITGAEHKQRARERKTTQWESFSLFSLKKERKKEEKNKQGESGTAKGGKIRLLYGG